MKMKQEKKQEEVKEKYPFFLSVFSPFREHKRGDLIFDQAEIEKIITSHEQHMVNRVLHTRD